MGLTGRSGGRIILERLLHAATLSTTEASSVVVMGLVCSSAEGLWCSAHCFILLSMLLEEGAEPVAEAL